MNSEETRWYDKLKQVISRSQMDELLEKREGTIGTSMGRRDFLKYSSMAGAMVGALAMSNRAGVVSTRDVQNQVKKLAGLGGGLDVVKSSSGVTLPDPLATRQSYLQWLGVKEVDNPTYERFYTSDTLPATISFNSPDYPKYNPAGKTPETMVPYATNLLDTNDPNDIAADIFELYPYRAQNPATMDTDSRIWYQFTQAIGTANKLASPSGTAIPITATSPNQVTGLDPTQWSFLIKKFGTFLGITNVGITQVKPNVHISTDGLANGYYISNSYANTYYPNVIVLGAAQPQQFNKIVTNETPTGGTTSTFNVGDYSEIMYGLQSDLLNLTAIKIANFINGMGYHAIPWLISSGTFQVPLMVDAGFGEASRCARCLTPDYGHDITPVSINTDMPLAYDKPIDFNAYNFCMRCEICADVCPSGSRPHGPPVPPRNGLNRPGMNFWFDGASCRAYWESGANAWGTGCGLCLAYCPWSEPRTWYHDLAKWGAINLGNTGIDTLVSLYKSDLPNRRVLRSDYIWSTEVEGVPSGRKDANLPPPW